MLREIRGTRYKRLGNEDIEQFISRTLRFLDFEQAVKFYDYLEDAEYHPDVLSFLGCNDRFYLLTRLLGRKDAEHPWIFNRCREVEADPDGHIDLWARYHYKSSIITFAGSIQEIICDPEVTIAIFSVTKSIAHKFLGQIKTEFEGNEKLVRVYHDVLWDNPRTQSPLWSVVGGLVVKRVGNPKEATIEAHGLIDGQPTGRHFKLHIYDDVVTQDHISSDMIDKTTLRWEMADNLATHIGARKWVAGTRYCTIADTRILMGDWSHKRIAEVKIGDVIVGWELRSGKRYLRRSVVLNCGSHTSQPVTRYTFENGRSVTCTEDHKWWRGPRGSNPEYNRLAVPGRQYGLSKIRQLLVPVEKDLSFDAGWLAGFFDGEGTVRKNPNHPSASIVITQSKKHPELIEKLKSVLTGFKFAFSERCVVMSDKPGQEKWSDRHDFYINGGWKERYRFLNQVSPARRDRIAETMFCQLTSDGLPISCVESAGNQDVFWLETETGNYVAEGFLSSNSFADTYGVMMTRGSFIPRIYPATHNGKLDGTPVFLTMENWTRIKRDQQTTVSAQMLLNPAYGSDATFDPTWLKTYEVIPAVLNVYIMCDPSKGRGQRSDRTAIAVVGIDPAGNKYFLDGVRHRMKLSDRWAYLSKFYHKWLAHQGVQMVKVGYEIYGQQIDLEVIQEYQDRDKDFFEIAELNTPNQGPHSKSDRIERLEPDIKGGFFYFPAVVYHPDFREQSNGVSMWQTWTDEDDRRSDKSEQESNFKVGQIVYRPLLGLTRLQRSVSNDRVVRPIRRIDETNKVYDVTRSAIEEVVQHPFGHYKDLVDALSRIYDMDPHAPMKYDASSLQGIEDEFSAEEGTGGFSLEDDLAQSPYGPN